jgi:hypothetical protein
MPLVFVHGVATRQTPEYRALVEQRDTLFKRLVMGEDDQIFDPDWGSNGVSFFHGGWVPKPGALALLAQRLVAFLSHISLVLLFR